MTRSKFSAVRGEGSIGSGGPYSGALDDGRVVMEPDLAADIRTVDEADLRQSSDGRLKGGARIVGGDDSLGPDDGPGPQVLAASSLEDEDVVNPQGEDLGEIKEIMIDIQSGRVAYAVLAFGGILGMGEKLFAIPWSALKLDADNKCFILDIDNERLKSAPGFDKDNWPSMADPEWAATIHSYYGASPYW